MEMLDITPHKQPTRHSRPVKRVSSCSACGGSSGLHSRESRVSWPGGSSASSSDRLAGTGGSCPAACTSVGPADAIPPAPSAAQPVTARECSSPPWHCSRVQVAAAHCSSCSGAGGPPRTVRLRQAAGSPSSSCRHRWHTRQMAGLEAGGQARAMGSAGATACVEQPRVRSRCPTAVAAAAGEAAAVSGDRGEPSGTSPAFWSRQHEDGRQQRARQLLPPREEGRGAAVLQAWLQDAEKADNTAIQ